MRFVHWKYLVLALALAVSPNSALAGVRATTQSTDGQTGAEPVLTEMALSGFKLRMDVQNPGQDRPPLSMIFDGQKQVLLIINHADKSVTRLDASTGNAIRQRQAAARAEVLSKLAKMPPEQRAMAEKLIAGHSGIGGFQDPEPGPPASPLRVRATGLTDNVGGRPCRLFEVDQDGSETAEICAQTWKDAGVTEQDLRALEQLGEFQTRMIDEVGGSPIASMHHPFDLFRQVKGIPLRTRQKDDRGSIRETIFTAIEPAEVDPKRFQPPPGYVARDLLPQGP
jgi:hypothetical protein